VTSRPNRVLAIVVGVVAVLAVVAAVLSATRPVADYAPGTPEGVVQSYLSAVLDGDPQQAAGLLAEDSPCAIDDLDQAYTPEGVRVVLRDTRVTGDTAQVRVDVVTPSGGPLDGSEYSEEHTFRLTRSGGGWRIEGSPWPMYACGKGA
jgi:phage tail protein X